MEVKHQRIPAELAAMLAQIAWYERRPVAAVIEDLAGASVRRRFEAIPKHLRERVPTGLKPQNAK